ncbi:TOPRIM nucleotidyl transferase/hydrolase domain-containing protein, partial [Vibrio paucivorans]
FEGVTEEQIAPVLFEKYFGKSNYALGISFISVSGKNYSPFISLAYKLGVPVCIVSDNDGNTSDEIASQIRKLEQKFNCTFSPEFLSINYLHNGCDIEAELVNHLGLVDELKQSLVQLTVNENDNPRYIEAKTNEFARFNNTELLEKLDSTKSGYSGFLADIIANSDKEPNQLIPQAFIDSFETIKEWRTL